MKRYNTFKLCMIIRYIIIYHTVIPYSNNYEIGNVKIKFVKYQQQQRKPATGSNNIREKGKKHAVTINITHPRNVTSEERQNIWKFIKTWLRLHKHMLRILLYIVKNWLFLSIHWDADYDFFNVIIYCSLKLNKKSWYGLHFTWAHLTELKVALFRLLVRRKSS